AAKANRDTTIGTRCMSSSSPGRPFHRAGIVARADVTRRGTYRARERVKARPNAWTLCKWLIYRADLCLSGRQPLNDLLTMPDLNSRHVRSAYHCPACVVSPTLVPARHSANLCAVRVDGVHARGISLCL